MRSSTKSAKGVDNAPETRAPRDKASVTVGGPDEPTKNTPQENPRQDPQDSASETATENAETVTANTEKVTENADAVTGGHSEPAETREELEDRLLRALAEQANIRERSLREIDRAAKFASSQFAGDLLDTADNLRLAIASIPEAASADPRLKPLLAGIVATERALMSALAKHGILPINAHGQPFDPAFHEAIHLVADKDRPSGTIIKVIKPGYMHHERLLRPAAVHVTTAPESDEGQ